MLCLYWLSRSLIAVEVHHGFTLTGEACRPGEVYLCRDDQALSLSGRSMIAVRDWIYCG